LNGGGEGKFRKSFGLCPEEAKKASGKVPIESEN